MNTVTRHLLKGTKDRDLIGFVEGWDLLESLIIEINKRGRAKPGESEAYAELRPALSRAYARWMDDLAPHWHGLEAGGRLVADDPFRAILGRARAQDFAGDWGAMQTLPAARQALNHFLIDLRQR